MEKAHRSYTASLIYDREHWRHEVATQQPVTPRISPPCLPAFNGRLVLYIEPHCEADLRVTEKY